MNHVLKKTFWELPTKTELEVHLMSRPFGMELGACVIVFARCPLASWVCQPWLLLMSLYRNDRSSPAFFANPHSPKGVVSPPIVVLLLLLLLLFPWLCFSVHRGGPRSCRSLMPSHRRVMLFAILSCKRA
jgi:hypothetical protein